MAYDTKNLVALVFSTNTTCTTVVDVEGPEGKRLKLKIDTATGKWSAPHHADPALADEVNNIGSSRYFRHGCEHTSDVIGVYDRTDTKHLGLMVSAGRTATQGDSHHFSAD